MEFPNPAERKVLIFVQPPGVFGGREQELFVRKKRDFWHCGSLLCPSQVERALQVELQEIKG